MTTIITQTSEKQLSAEERMNSVCEWFFDLYSDPDMFRKWILIQYSLHKYSPMNRAYIFKQNPQTTHVATFNAWKKLGFSINKGAKALKVFVPITLELFKDENGHWQRVSSATKDQKQLIQKRYYEMYSKLLGYKYASVFDVADTTANNDDFIEKYDIPDFETIVKKVAKHTSSPVPDNGTLYEKMESLVRMEVKREEQFDRKKIKSISKETNTTPDTILETLYDIETVFLLTKVGYDHPSIRKNLIERLNWSKESDKDRNALKDLNNLACREADKLWQEFQYIFE